MLWETSDYILSLPFNLLSFILGEHIYVTIIVDIEPLIDSRHESVNHLHQQFRVRTEIKSLDWILRNIEVEDLEVLLSLLLDQLEVEVEEASTIVELTLVVLICCKLHDLEVEDVLIYMRLFYLDFNIFVAFDQTLRQLTDVLCIQCRSVELVVSFYLLQFFLIRLGSHLCLTQQLDCPIFEVVVVSNVGLILWISSIHSVP